MTFFGEQDFIFDKNACAKTSYYDNLHILFIEAYQDFQCGRRTDNVESYREAMAKFMVIYQLDDRQKMLEGAKIKMMEIAYSLDIPWETVQKAIEPLTNQQHVSH